jgi:hypothetical protein
MARDVRWELSQKSEGECLATDGNPGKLCDNLCLPLFIGQEFTVHNDFDPISLRIFYFFHI